jgi:hypothetical protein
MVGASGAGKFLHRSMIPQGNRPVAPDLKKLTLELAVLVIIGRMPT